MEKIIYLLFIIGFSFCGTLEFDVTFMGFNAAKVNIIEIDTVFNGYNAKSIIFNTQTVASAKTIFPIDNNYHTIITNDFKKILYFEKSTAQPWLENNLSTDLINEKVKYKNSSIEIPSNFLNIFTLLQYLNHISVENLLNNTFFIDREGLQYKATFEILSEENNDIELTLNLDIIENESYPIIENTDIFTWAVFKKDAKRILRIKNGRLIYCKFSTGFITMKATLVEK